MRTARARGAELGVESIGAATASLLTVLAATLGAEAVIEIGTGTGVGSAALLAGMTDEAILTSIDVEAENQRVAREILGELGFDHIRARLITGRALEVLPRLTDGGYDLLISNGDRTEFPTLVGQARRLLRPGGVLVLNHSLGNGGLADSAARDAAATALREASAMLRDEEHWAPVLLTVGSGLLVATLRY